MKFFPFLLVIVFLSACGESQPKQSIPQSSQALSVYPIDQRIDRDTYEGFLDLMALQQDIPKAMIAAHTLLGNPKGFFYGKERWVINEQVQALILHQQTPTGRHNYLLTTDGTRTLDQRMITENYELSGKKVVGTYKTDSEGHILCITRKFVQGEAPQSSSTTFGVLANGEIVKVAR
ncbi:MAG: hypothetical protein AAFQ83_15595 [Bacteroidota bacterium]